MILVGFNLAINIHERWLSFSTQINQRRAPECFFYLHTRTRKAEKACRRAVMSICIPTFLDQPPLPLRHSLLICDVIRDIRRLPMQNNRGYYLRVAQARVRRLSGNDLWVRLRKGVSMRERCTYFKAECQSTYLQARHSECIDITSKRMFPTSPKCLWTQELRCLPTKRSMCPF